MSKTNETTNWPELAIGLYDKLTGRNAEITYEFDKMEIGVPAGVGDQPKQAQWNLNGTLKIRTRDVSK